MKKLQASQGFVGPLTGNADTSDTATNALNVNVTPHNNEPEDIYITLVDGFYWISRN